LKGCSRPKPDINRPDGKHKYGSTSIGTTGLADPEGEYGAVIKNQWQDKRRQHAKRTRCEGPRPKDTVPKTWKEEENLDGGIAVHAARTRDVALRRKFWCRVL
jgi:hypothetical protein